MTGDADGNVKNDYGQATKARIPALADQLQAIDKNFEQYKKQHRAEGRVVPREMPQTCYKND